MIKLKVRAGQVALCDESTCIKSFKENLALGNALVGNGDAARALRLTNGYAELTADEALFGALINGASASIEVDGLPLPHHTVFLVPAGSTLTLNSSAGSAYLIVAGGLQFDTGADGTADSEVAENAEKTLRRGASAELFLGTHQNRRCEVGDYIARGAFRRRTPKQLLHVLRTEGDNLGDWGGAIALEACDSADGVVMVGGGEQLHVAEVDWPMLGLLRKHQRVHLRHISAEEDRQLAAKRRQALSQPGVAISKAQSKTNLLVDDEQHTLNFSPLLTNQTYGQSQIQIKAKQTTIHISSASVPTAEGARGNSR